MIAPSKKRAGHAKAARKARKEANREGLKQTSRLVEALAGGLIPSMAKVQAAHETGFRYKDRKVLRGMTVLNRTRSSKIVVAEKRKMPCTDATKIRSVLPTKRIESCQTQIALFQNGWFSDFEQRIPSFALSVKTGGVVYNFQMLKAMSSWHLAVQRFNEVRDTITWLNNVDLTGWNLNDSWKTGLLFPKKLETRLEDIDIFGDYFWVTTLRRHCLVELSCVDLALKALTSRYAADRDVFSVPSYLIRYPEFDREEVSKSEVWPQIRAAAEQKKLWSESVSEERGNPMWLFAVIFYRNEHWCAAAVNFEDLTITVFDPQRTGDRFQALRKYLHSDLVPLLPEPPSPKRYRFKQVEWMTQVDSVNCGVFVITFFEMLLLDVAITGSDSVSESTIAMQYFRYRFLSHILSSM